jgi:hypothetical protein
MNRILKYLKKRKRARDIKKLKGKIPPYLQKNFAEELNYKLWVTKGARFNASSRCKRLHQLSNNTAGYLSAYLIIISIVNIYEVPFFTKLPNNYLAFGITALSILILVFTQIEASKNFLIASEKYHLCALEISEIYDELRMLKSNNTVLTSAQLRPISEKYQILLKKYENHEHIDLLLFTTTKPKYFELSKFDCIWIRLSNWFHSSMKYHLFILFPLFVFVLFQIMN